MKITDYRGVPPVTPVARVGDRAPQPFTPCAPIAPKERVKPKHPARDAFVATGEERAPQQPLVYDRSAWARKVLDRVECER